MTDTELQRLKSLASAFHFALERMNFTETGSNLARFPHECCHHACRLLGIFLFENGFARVQEVVGRRPDDPSPQGKHLWLDVEGVIVDITAYQFEGVIEKVIVTPASEWHARLAPRTVQFGMPGEPLPDYLARMRAHFNERHDQLYDELAAIGHSWLDRMSAQASASEG